MMHGGMGQTVYKENNPLAPIVFHSARMILFLLSDDALGKPSCKENPKKKRIVHIYE
jgi:hypothetical protein